MLTGKHLIASNWETSDTQFNSQPVAGDTHEFAIANCEQVAKACEAAEAAFWSYGYSIREQRAEFLHKIADEIETRAEAITQIGVQETGLPAARLQGERDRTTGQLRLFAAHILNGDFLDRRHDSALPDRQPLPRPELHMIQRPIGPVAVFGASNFPLAFSTAGGDTAAALAAGCPVVVKGHDAHPGTGELVAQAIDAALKACDLHPGVFGFVQGNNYEVGQTLVQHPLIKAVGFTGSLRGGRALYNLCAEREEPIPFFGELGSVNPMFLLPAAMAERSDDIAQGWAASLTMGAGQFCTNPGVIVSLSGEDTERFISTATTALQEVGAQTMLTDGIAAAYRAGNERMRDAAGVNPLFSSSCQSRQAKPNLYRTTAQAWLNNTELSEEIFGPAGIIVVAENQQEMLDIARQLQGQLTCSLHIDAGDTELAQQLLPILERKAGRILANGFPTGVEVADSMVHGGPYPASTNFGATSVGTLAIRRFLRPVCYQNLPANLLPGDLLA